MKIKLTINPNQGINNIEFGMDRKKVHSIIGLPSDSFYKSASDPNMSEEYKDLKLFIYYDKKDRVGAIEAWDEALIVYNELDLFQTKHKDLFQYFKKKDPDTKVLSDTLISYLTGIIIWYENDVTDKSLCTSVTAFRKGYFEKGTL